MAHVNQQVREAVKTALEGGSFTSLSTNRGADLEHADLPAGVIGTGDDEVATGAKTTKTGPPKEKRTLNLTVTIVADGASATLDDDLDDLRVEVEAAVKGDLGGLSHRTEHTGGELEMGTDEDGERWFAFLVLSWEIDVWTVQGDPETVL